MTYLVFNSEEDAINALESINCFYGCPFVASNGYYMERWDELKTTNDNRWFFSKPKEDAMHLALNSSEAGAVEGAAGEN